MGDLTSKERSGSTKLVGALTDGTETQFAQIDNISGVRRLRTDSLATVLSTSGLDPLPDTYFTITKAGADTDTWRVQIAGITDPTASERDLPAVDVTITVTATEENDEIAVRDLIIDELNSDTNFQNAFLRAQPVTNRAIVHITSDTLFSLSGEFYERPIAGDVSVAVTGVAEALLAFDTLIARPKETTLARDPDNPHRLGILGISGTVISTPGAVGDQFILFAEDTGSPNLLVDGSVTPVDFVVASEANFDLIITEIRFAYTGSNIKFGQFLANNQPLTNGVLVTVKSDDSTFTFPLFKETEDFKHFFSSVDGWLFDTNQAGRHSMVSARAIPTTPLIIKETGSFGTDDFLKVTIQDDLTPAQHVFFEFFAIGFRKAV